MKTPGDATVWVLFCAFWNCTGWILSALHCLNPAGYLVAIGLAVLALWLTWHLKNPTSDFGLWTLDFSVWNTRRLRRRAHRLFPLGFFILAALAFLGGLLYAPSNYDALAYRTPRVFHWLVEGRWHWIHSDFARLNVRTCGMEWVTAPLLAFTRTDRGFFLISFVSFLLLPGRVFSLLTRLGVRGRVAWNWMWLLPTGYCFLLQAGSIGNDLFGAVLALLAVEFALRAAKTGRLFEAYLSVLAAALMTAGKAFNLLLLLPWGLAMLPNLRLLFSRPLPLLPLGLAAAGASLIPTAILNFHVCRDWTGMKLEQATNLANGARVFHVAVNTVLLCLHNLVPPIFPWASAWNKLMDNTIPPDLAARLQHNFESFAAQLHVGEMQMEESAGFGLGVSLLLMVWLAHRLFNHPRLPRRSEVKTGSHALTFSRSHALLPALVPLGAVIATLIFMSQSGLACPARYLGPFCILFIPLLLGYGPASATLIRYAWFRYAGLAVFVAAALLLVVSPARPLWPAQTVLRALGADHSSHPLVCRAWTVYSVYGARGDAFAPAKAALPPNANPLGLVTSDDPETSLWRPFGSRRIIHICKNDTAESVRAAGLRYALVNSVVLNTCQTSLEEWLTRFNAELMQTMNLELRASLGPKEWYLVRFKSPVQTNAKQ